MTFPLEGTRVLDLSQAVSGPFAGRILTDLGCDVVKVEWPKGDLTNLFGPQVGGLSGLFVHMNAGKRSVSIDRTVRTGADLVRALARRADVVIENFRPSVLEGCDLGYAALSAEHPRLIMLSISGFGQTGPEANRRAYAPVIHAEAGIVGRQAQIDDRPHRDLALALADSVSSQHGVIAILAALVLRDRTGKGQHIDLSMLEALVASDDYMHYAIARSDDVYAPRGGVWEVSGGPIMIAADPKTTWARIARHAGLRDPDPDAPLARKVAARERLVGEWLAGFPSRAALVAELDAADLAWGDVRTTGSVLESPSLHAREVVRWPRDHVGELRGVVRMPYRFSDGDCDVRGAAPTPGQHNRSVLHEWLGYDDATIDRLVTGRALWADHLSPADAHHA